MRRGEDEHGARRWRIPPAILRGPQETIDRIGVLDEHEEDVALLLWRIVRDVELWAATQPEQRGELFGPGAAVQRAAQVRAAPLDDEVRPALEILAGLLADPVAAEGERIGGCCLRVARWAREAGKGETAVACAQAAALASPEDGVAALVTGLCAAALGQAERGHTWLRRAVAVARQSRQREAYAGAYLALGHHHLRAGARESARRAYLLALRAARRWGLWLERAGAAYGLFRLALEGGDVPAATAHGRGALLAARRLPPELVPFGMEMPAFWIAVGEPARALAVLARIEPLLRTHGDRLAWTVFSLRARLDGGDTAEARRLWAEAWRQIRDEPLEDAAVGKALVALAGAAARLGDGALLGRAARAALTRAPADAYARVQEQLRELGFGAAAGEEQAA
jgi:tetratricopeptide (TPR) repeat protein